MAFVYWIHFKEHDDIFSQGYVGITSRTVQQRFNQHKKPDKKRSSVIGKIMMEHGNSVIVTTLCECSINYAGELEFKLRPSEKIGWNLAIGGNTVKSTKEGRQRVSDALKGRKKPQHVMDAMNSARLSKPVSQETRDRISKSSKGRTNSPETRRKISENRKGINPPRSRESVLASIQTFADKHPLDLPNQNKEAWLKCDLFYHEFLKGHSRFIAAKNIGGSKGSLVAMWKRFTSGWNPLEDIRYRNYLLENKG